LYKHGLTLLKDKIMFERFIAFEERVEKRRQEEVIENGLKKEENVHLRTELMQALNLGTKLFPEEQKFWLMTIDKYINAENYILAEQLIKTAARNIDAELLEDIKLCKVKILKKLQKLIEAKCEL
jgi:hypothetical protein